MRLHLTKTTYLISARDRPSMAAFASACDAITINPRRRDALSTVARMTECSTFPYCANSSVYSVLSQGMRILKTVKGNERLLSEIEGKAKNIEVTTLVRTVTTVGVIVVSGRSESRDRAEWYR